MSISLLSKGMGHSDMSRNWCARVNFPSKQLRGGVNHLALGSINSYYYTGWGEQGSREISRHRVGGSVNNKKKTTPPAMSRVTQGSSQVSFGSQGRSWALSPLSVGLGALSPLQDWGQSHFQWPSGLHIRQSPCGFFPQTGHLSFQQPSWLHLFIIIIF